MHIHHTLACPCRCPGHTNINTPNHKSSTNAGRWWLWMVVLLLLPSPIHVQSWVCECNHALVCEVAQLDCMLMTTCEPKRATILPEIIKMHIIILIGPYVLLKLHVAHHHLHHHQIITSLHQCWITKFRLKCNQHSSLNCFLRTNLLLIRLPHAHVLVHVICMPAKANAQT